MLPYAAAGLKGICSFVFERGDDFPQILDFTNEMSRQYGLHVHKLHADFRSGVEGLLETTKLKAIILGTRRYSTPCGIIAVLPVRHPVLSMSGGLPSLAQGHRLLVVHPLQCTPSFNSLPPAVLKVCPFRAQRCPPPLTSLCL